MIDYNELSPDSRVWIYQANRELTAAEAEQLRPALQQFARQWVSHNRQLKAHADLHHQRFIVLMVDESQAGASGCSIDASVHFIKSIEQHFDVQLFDRMTFAYRDEEGHLQFASSSDFAELYQKGLINDDTPVFDNLVKTKADFDTNWQKPLSTSWHKRMV